LKECEERCCPDGSDRHHPKFFSQRYTFGIAIDTLPRGIIRKLANLVGLAKQ
jgi:hypothetical protein